MGEANYYLQSHWDYIGLIGGCIISVILVPQIVKAYRTQSTEDLSWTMLGTYFVGLAMIGIYAFAEGLLPIAIPWAMEMGLLIVQVFLKFYFDRMKKRKQILKSSQFKEDQKSSGEMDVEVEIIPQLAVA